MSTQTPEAVKETPTVATTPEAPQLWKPWPDLENLQSEWAETFNNFWSRAWPMPISQLRAAAAQHFQPALNLYTDKDSLVVEAALPGVDKKDVNIHATRDSLSISGEYRQEKKEEKDKYFHSEIRQGSFRRKLTLPAEVNPEKVEAKLKDGILKITLPLVDPGVQEGVKVSID